MHLSSSFYSQVDPVTILGTSFGLFCWGMGGGSPISSRFMNSYTPNWIPIMGTTEVSLGGRAL